LEVAGAERLWAIVSVLMHGLTVTPIMRLLDRKQGGDPDAAAIPPPQPAGTWRKGVIGPLLSGSTAAT
jgi:hypothetical protein